ncbi:MAG: hypothetical protein LBF60_09475 [Treponema sp.]|jgi:chromosome segregation ATPase|nr:hypothetical protein [Treponema sp.]
MEVMTAEQAAEWGKTLSFEKVWAALMENRKQLQKTDEQLQKTDEQMRKTDERQAKERERMQKENDEQMRKLRETVAELSKNVGGLNRSMGELIETLIASRLWEKFADYPYNLKRAYQRIPLYDENNYIKTDIDILLSDTE